MQHSGMFLSILKYSCVHGCILLGVLVYCNDYNALQLTATHYNTLLPTNVTVRCSLQFTAAYNIYYYTL